MKYEKKNILAFVCIISRLVLTFATFRATAACLSFVHVAIWSVSNSLPRQRARSSNSEISDKTLRESSMSWCGRRGERSRRGMEAVGCSKLKSNWKKKKQFLNAALFYSPLRCFSVVVFLSRKICRFRARRATPASQCGGAATPKRESRGLFTSWISLMSKYSIVFTHSVSLSISLTHTPASLHACTHGNTKPYCCLWNPPTGELQRSLLFTDPDGGIPRVPAEDEARRRTQVQGKQARHANRSACGLLCAAAISLAMIHAILQVAVMCWRCLMESRVVQSNKCLFFFRFPLPLSGTWTHQLCGVTYQSRVSFCNSDAPFTKTKILYEGRRRKAHADLARCISHYSPVSFPAVAAVME